MRLGLPFLVVAVGLLVGAPQGSAQVPGIPTSPMEIFDSFTNSLDAAISAVTAVASSPAIDKVKTKTLKTLEKIQDSMEGATTFAEKLKALSTAAKSLAKDTFRTLMTALGVTNYLDMMLAEITGVVDMLKGYLPAALKLGRMRNPVGSKERKAIDKAGTVLMAAMNMQFAAALKVLPKPAALLETYLKDVVIGGLAADWVIQTLTVAPSGQGVDLDDDGVPDNDLADIMIDMPLAIPDIPLKPLLDEFLATAMARVPAEPEPVPVPVIQVWGLGGWGSADNLAWIGFLQGNDTDRNRADNFSGSETFDASASVALDGHARIRAPVSVGSDGSYEYVLSGEFLEMAGFTDPVITPGLQALIDGAAPFGSKGVMTATTHTGFTGMALPVGKVMEIIDAKLLEKAGGPGLLYNTLKAALQAQLIPSIDTNGDGVDDGIAVAYAWSAVRCNLTTSN